MKKFLLAFLLIGNIFTLFSVTFTPKYYLSGVYPTTDNKLYLWRFPERLSFTHYNSNLLGVLNQDTSVKADYDSRLFTLTFKFKNTNIAFVPVIYLDENVFFNNKYKFTFRDLLKKKTEDIMNKTDRAQGSGLIKEIVIDLPKFAIPRHLKKFLGGKEAARLNLNGSQKVTFDYNHRNSSKKGDEKNNNNDQDFLMKQDLNLTLNGTIGKKIHINVTHKSNSGDDVLATPDVVKIWYEGLEDEVVKKVEGGNIAFNISGSKFFSANVSSEGLFGVKTEMEAGNLKVTSIVAKEESSKEEKTYSPNKTQKNSEKKSYQYEKDKYFYVIRPDSLFEFYTESDTIPEGWANNAIKLNSYRDSLMIKPGIREYLPVADSTMYIFYDDGTGTNLDETIPGKSIDPSDSTIYNLRRIMDFNLDAELGIIRLSDVTMSNETSLGIAYYRRGQGNPVLVGDYSSDTLRVKIIKIRDQDEDSPTWDYTLRNIYSLGATNIESEGFELNFYDKSNTTGTENYNLSEDIIGSSNVLTYIDYLRLDTSGNGLIEGDDAFVNLSSGTIFFPFIKPFQALEPETDIYSANPITSDAIVTISIKGQISSDNIELPAMNLLKGSVKITSGGETFIENVDYMVDYDFGIITLISDKIRQKNANLVVKYEYKPLFVLDRRTLMGFRADLDINENYKFGSTFIFQGEKVQEDRPTIGNENRSIILADVDSEIKYNPPLLTKLVNWLPLIKTDAESRMSLTAEMGMSIPHVYGNSKLGGKDQAYLDDMESILESTSLGVTRPAWTFASKPIKAGENNLEKAHINWFNKDNFYARQVYDNLTEKQGKEEITVLSCRIDSLSQPNTPYWAGLMRYIGEQINNFPEKKYIQLLVKVDEAETLNDPIIMHLDIGQKINEDFYTKNNNENVLNTEDKNLDGELDITEDEDTGLDGVKGDDDKNIAGDDGDDDYDNKKVGGIYPKINGMEDNGKLDTEDLNRNGILDKANEYFEYNIDISSNNGVPVSDYFESQSSKGWNLYKIPINAVDKDSVNSPNLSKIRFARIWFETKEPITVNIVEMDVIGNKWKESVVKDEYDQPVDNGDLEANDEYFSLSVIDNQRNQHYTPPKNTVVEKSGEKTLEQSLIIDYHNLQSDHKGIVYQKVSNPHSTNTNESLNLLSYKKMKFWAYLEYPEDNEGNEELDQKVIFRLGPDSLNYYEIINDIKPKNYNSVFTDGNWKMNKSNWQEFGFSFPEITDLKLENSQTDTTKFKIVGKPTLTNIKYIFVGLDAQNDFSGRLYIDDIRVAEPFEDIGFGARAAFSTSFADFSTFDLEFSWTTPNFQTQVSRDTHLSYTEQKSMDIRNTYALGKFFPYHWGFNIPLALHKTHTIGIPIYQANSDILLSDMPADERKDQENLTNNVSASIAFSQSRTPNSKILQYLVKNVSMNASVNKSENITPTVRDTTVGYHLEHKYNMNIPKDSLSLKLYKNYRFYFLPNRFDNTITFDYSHPRKWTWNAVQDSSYWQFYSQSKDTKNVDTSSSVNYDIFSDIALTYTLNTTRDLFLENYWKSIPIGEEKSRSQKITANYSPKYMDRVFTFSSNASADYHDQQQKSSSSDTLRYTGDVTRTLGADINLKNNDLLMNLINKIKGKNKSANQQEKTPKENEEQKKKDGENQKKNTSPPENEKKKEEERYNTGNDNINPNEIKDVDSKGDEKEEKKEEEKDKENKDYYKGSQAENIDIVKAENYGLTAKILSYFARLKNISFSLNNTYSTNFNSRSDRPNFAYQIGVPSILSNEELSTRNLGYTYSISSGLQLLPNLSTNFSYVYNYARRYNSGNSNQTIDINYPALDLSLTSFEKVLNKISFLDSLLESSTINSTFDYSSHQEGEIAWTKPYRDKKTYSFGPLFHWQGNWINSITTDFSITHSSSNEYTYSVKVIQKTELNQALSGKITYRFSAPGGLKIPFIGDKIKFKNNLTTSLDCNITKVLSKTISEGKENITKNSLGLKITPSASYEFNESIDAGLSGSIENTNNKERAEKTNLIKLSLWIEIKF